MLSCQRLKVAHNKIRSSSILYHNLGDDLTPVKMDKLLSNSIRALQSVTRFSRNYHSLNKPTLRLIKSEYKAVCALMTRSGFPNDFGNLYFAAQRSKFHSSPQFSNNSDKNKSDKGPSGKKKPNEDDNNMSSLVFKAAFWMFVMYMFASFISLMVPSDKQTEIIRYVSWNEFVYHMLSKGEVEELIVRPDMEVVTILLHEGAIVKGKKVTNRIYHMNIGDMRRFEEKLREVEKSLGVKESVPVIYERSEIGAASIIKPLLIATIILLLISRLVKVKTDIKVDNIFQLGRAKYTLVDPLIGQGKGVRFKDVAGLKEAKIEVMEFVDYLKRPEHYKSLGAKVPKGALLLGPPGCGKTLLAKAVATEASVPFLSMNGSEFIEMIGGLGAARVRDLFKDASTMSPCIVYIDEIDAVGRQRAGGGGSGMKGFDGGESEQTLNQLLVEMDGMATTEGVVVLASTNRADVLDKALLRPGRFDRHILIDLPNLQERREIFERHLKNIVLENEPNHYSKRLAYLTPGFSGADIANVCNEAALHAARFKQANVKAQNLEYAVERHVGGTEKRNHAMSPEEKRTVAYHESGHALVGWLLEHTDALLKVTIVPRTSLALGFAQYTPTDQKLYSKEELFDRMCMTLGGRVAEALTFNRITTGAQNDLDKVTKSAYAQIRQYGMSKTVGLLWFPVENERSGKSPYSKTLKSLIDLEVRKLIADAYYRTEDLLRENSDKLQIIAEALLKKETLNYNDVVELIGPPPHPGKKFIDPVEFEMSVRNLENANEMEDSSLNPKDAPSAKNDEANSSAL